jgi:hypothetical protein
MSYLHHRSHFIDYNWTTLEILVNVYHTFNLKPIFPQNTVSKGIDAATVA